MNREMFVNPHEFDSDEAADISVIQTSQINISNTAIDNSQRGDGNAGSQTKDDKSSDLFNIQEEDAKVENKPE